MHSLLRLPYAAAGAAAQVAVWCAPPGGGKLSASLRARRGIIERYAEWGASRRDPSRPLLWMHAPSVGEGLMARPVIELLRAKHPQLQIAYTFFSPSAAAFAAGIGADFFDYLPFDTGANARAALRALRPTALIFSKLDVWPAFVANASNGGARTGLISATLTENSARNSSLAHLLLHDTYGALDAVGAVAANDAARLIRLGARAGCTQVTGDTRYDQVAARAAAVNPGNALLAPLQSSRPTLVAGSTWPRDDERLLHAWKLVREHVPAARMIIAPHEPSASQLAGIEAALGPQLSVARLGTAAQATADVILVDRVGVLGDLYALADAAYVGGGFHSAGLHSVLEPAAFGAPVVFGPRHSASRDAALLLANGGGFTAESVTDLASRLITLLTETDTRAAAGSRARALVQSGLGAAEKSAAMVEGLLDIS